METLQNMDKYGLFTIIIGLFACLVCGLLKVPIARKIKNSIESSGVSEKQASQRLRNICNLIVMTICVIAITVWSVVGKGWNVFLTSDYYAEIITAFTISKIAYMLYEGAGEVSIKKLAHILFANVSNKLQGDKNIPIVDVAKQELPKDNIRMQINKEQIQELLQLISINSGNKE